MHSRSDDTGVEGPEATGDDTSPAWRPDLLGDGFERRTLHLPDGAQVTLVRLTPSLTDDDGAARRVAVLYVHGFVDYFFHPHLARALADPGALAGGDPAGVRGYAFYAVDLRGHGRSLAAHTAAGGDPNLVADIALHARDLDAAAAAIRAAGHERLVVLGHSTGGLIATLWAAARPGRADALVLNSPWFDLNEPWLLRGPGTRVIDAVARVAPRLPVGGLAEHYGRALHVVTGGEWDYDLAWKPHAGFPVRAGWFRSVRAAQGRVRRGVDVGVPTLVLASARSGPSRRAHDALLTTDSVLDVGHIRRAAQRIGSDVLFVPVEGGAHDLALSPRAGREEYLRAVTAWLAARAPA
ncbi:alpha/beta hydrolase [Xylanimonas ulmi]|uniref:Alpha-beta hydrolase superfamily lysophospholipase n=1 Tax=Xylanimonas ulmi TaxID=228973 RepID=A0A4V2EYB4_9MICO|nr:alpha/beta hydrolase [Xylanibacterium ulmi]RZS62400.1 alpha-beta hydrolase superfamily lysophospholipase [Xylanibacterium ulmi]